MRWRYIMRRNTLIKTIKMELIIRKEIQRRIREGDSVKEDGREKKGWPDEVLLENTRRIFICFSAAGINRSRGRERKRNEGGITGNTEKRVEKQNRGRTAGLCSSVLVALLPLCCLAELRWPRAILEQIRLPLCVHYFLLTFAKR